MAMVSTVATNNGATPVVNEVSGTCLTSKDEIKQGYTREIVKLTIHKGLSNMQSNQVWRLENIFL